MPWEAGNRPTAFLGGGRAQLCTLFGSRRDGEAQLKRLSVDPLDQMQILTLEGEEKAKCPGNAYWLG